MAEVTVTGREPLERPLRKGDVIRFGSYLYGDCHEKEITWAPMEWLVLRYERRLAFVVSRYGIEPIAFHSKHSYSLWQYSALIQWLNSEFHFFAFSPYEKPMIVQDEVITPPNPKYLPKVPWEDCAYPRLYLLSCQEALEYFGSNAERRCEPTPFAATRGVTHRGKYCSYWLRTPGPGCNVASVGPNGNISYRGRACDYEAYAVRPAMTILVPCRGDDLNADPDLKREYHLERHFRNAMLGEGVELFRFNESRRQEAEEIFQRPPFVLAGLKYDCLRHLLLGLLQNFIEGRKAVLDGSLALHFTRFDVMKAAIICRYALKMQVIGFTTFESDYADFLFELSDELGLLFAGPGEMGDFLLNTALRQIVRERSYDFIDYTHVLGVLAHMLVTPGSAEKFVLARALPAKEYQEKIRAFFVRLRKCPFASLVSGAARTALMAGYFLSMSRRIAVLGQKYESPLVFLAEMRDLFNRNPAAGKKLIREAGPELKFLAEIFPDAESRETIAAALALSEDRAHNHEAGDFGKL